MSIFSGNIEASDSIAFWQWIIEKELHSIIQTGNDILLLPAYKIYPHKLHENPGRKISSQCKIKNNFQFTSNKFTRTLFTGVKPTRTDYSATFETRYAQIDCRNSRATSVDFVSVTLILILKSETTCTYDVVVVFSLGAHHKLCNAKLLDINAV